MVCKRCVNLKSAKNVQNFYTGTKKNYTIFCTFLCTFFAHFLHIFFAHFLHILAFFSLKVAKFHPKIAKLALFQKCAKKCAKECAKKCAKMCKKCAKNCAKYICTNFAPFLHLHFLHICLHLRPREDTVTYM